MYKRQAIGWSYDLLTAAEQLLFKRLAVFAGGCTLDAAEIMCADALSPAQVLGGFASLLDKSLLHRETGVHGEPRYVMLETVREYGLERVASSGEDVALHTRHVSCFLQLIEKAEQPGREIGFLQVRYLIDDDIYNVRAALAWAIGNDVQAALLLTAPFLDWYGQRDSYAEGRRLIDKVFALPGASAPTVPRAKVLAQAGILMHWGHEDGKAQAYEEESLALSRVLGYGKGEADALQYLGRIAHIGWLDQDTAQGYFEQALASYRTLADPGGAATVLFLLAEIALDRADFPRARALAEECLTVAEQAGFRFSWPLSILAAIAYGEGDLDRARALYEQKLAMEEARGQIGANLATLNDLVRVATPQGDFKAAHAFVDRVLAREQKKGIDSGAYLCECYLLLAMLVQAEGDYGSAIHWYRAGTRGIKYLTYDWKLWGLGLAGMAVALDQHELAARLLGATDGTDVADYRLFPIERDNYNRLAAATRAQLGAAAFDVAWAEGRTSPFEQVVEEALLVLEEALRVQDQAPPA